MKAKSKPKRGRPLKRSADRKVEYLDVRLDASEKRAFKTAADVSGLPLSSWVRARLRRAAISDLQQVGQIPEFLKGVVSEG